MRIDFDWLIFKHKIGVDMSKLVNTVFAATLLASAAAHADYISGDMQLRDAMYVYGMNVTEKVSKEYWGINCDVLQVVFKMDAGSTAFRYVQSDNSTTANTPTSRTWYPDTIYSNQAMFAYALYQNRTYKVFGFEDRVRNTSASIGNGSFFAYCYSTNPGARIFLWDGESCRIKYSNGTYVNSVCL